jgi:hypothetical protein
VAIDPNLHAPTGCVETKPPDQVDDLSLIGRYVPERNRPTGEPGGMECFNCGCIFIGAEWHDYCAVCQPIRDAALRAKGGERG